MPPLPKTGKGIQFAMVDINMSNRPLTNFLNGQPVDEMYLASLINKGRQAYEKGMTDPTALPVETILQMATINGAKSVLWENEIGSLEIGKKVSLLNIT